MKNLFLNFHKNIFCHKNSISTYVQLRRYQFSNTKEEINNQNQNKNSLNFQQNPKPFRIDRQLETNISNKQSPQDSLQRFIRLRKAIISECKTKFNFLQNLKDRLFVAETDFKKVKEEFDKNKQVKSKIEELSEKQKQLKQLLQEDFDKNDSRFLQSVKQAKHDIGQRLAKLMQQKGFSRNEILRTIYSLKNDESFTSEALHYDKVMEKEGLEMTTYTQLTQQYAMTRHQLSQVKVLDLDIKNKWLSQFDDKVKLRIKEIKSDLEAITLELEQLKTEPLKKFSKIELELNEHKKKVSDQRRVVIIENRNFERIHSRINANSDTIREHCEIQGLNVNNIDLSVPKFSAEID